MTMSRVSDFDNFLSRYRVLGGPSYYIVSLFSKGDTYLLGSVAQELYKIHRSRGFRVVLFVRESHQDIAELFADRRVRFILVPDEDIDRLQKIAFDSGYCSPFKPESLLLVHPAFMGSQSIDQLTFVGALSQIDMYRYLLQVPLGGSFDIGSIPESWFNKGRRLASSLDITPGEGVLLLPGSNSWPELDPTFWQQLTQRLEASGLRVFVNSVRNSKQERRVEYEIGTPISCDLPTLFGLSQEIGWVIGTLTGVMNIMISTQTKCAKSLLARGPGTGKKQEFGPTVSFATAFPYAFQRTYDGCDYDIEEFEVTPQNECDVINDLVESWNRIRPNGSAIRRRQIQAIASFGDVIDRISILEVKKLRIKKQNIKYNCNREILRLWSALSVEGIYKADVAVELESLIDINTKAFVANEILHETFDQSPIGHTNWSINAQNADELYNIESVAKAFRLSQHLNRQRVAWKQVIDRKFGSLISEEKSFICDLEEEK
ncbi:hypothetical protein [Azospirillum griseum]|uniref:Uncharacterized protein n=1 Tax=Azospirillum griseum TaxID=2496639 RepID=A0A431V9P8_9PROT|nr:hypothetical protein [Azospirillum griseum]RTR11992.1 hypothetical protein EJ903_25800 [Azospirillum griseum]